MAAGDVTPDSRTSESPVTQELDRLERHPHVARLIRSLADHPPIVVRAEPPMRLAAILLAPMVSRSF